MKKDIRSKKYSFPHDTKPLAKKLDNISITISILSGAVVTVWIAWLVISTQIEWPLQLSFDSASDAILIGTAGILLGAASGIFVVMSVSFTIFTVFESDIVFPKTKLGKQVNENFTHFTEWMKFNFHVDVTDFQVKNGKSRGADWFIAKLGSPIFIFQDTTGTSFSLNPVEGVENEYLVSFLKGTSDTISNGDKSKKTDSVFVQFFSNYGDKLGSETQEVIVKTISLIEVLDKIVLEPESFKTVSLVKGELDKLSALMLDSVPLGIEPDVEEEFLVGLRILNETLISIHDYYKTELKNKISSRVKEVEFFFQQ